VLRLARFIRLARFVVIVARALQAERRLTSGGLALGRRPPDRDGNHRRGRCATRVLNGRVREPVGRDWRPQINRVCAAARRGDPPALANLIRSKTSEAVGREVTRREPDVRSGRNPGLDIQPSGRYLSN
jgi:hypothetical protein